MYVGVTHGFKTPKFEDVMNSTTFTLSAIGAMLLFLAACSGVPTATDNNSTQKGADKVYTGVLPAADVDGIRYTVLLDFDDDNTGGDYELVETYFVTDSTGVQDVESFASDGDFIVGTGAQGQKYIKLSGDGSGEVYFLADTDSTLTMVDASLSPAAASGMNYTLKAAK